MKLKIGHYKSQNAKSIIASMRSGGGGGGGGAHPKKSKKNQSLHQNR